MQEPYNLIKDFIDEKLQGDLQSLVNFDLAQLRGDRKYGTCGRAFDCDNTTGFLTRILSGEDMVTVIAYIIIPHFSETRIFGIAFRTVHFGTAICKRFQIYEKH